MQKKKRWIPFSWLPGSWGLKGKVYEEAAAHYYYDGIDLDLKLAEIKHAEDQQAFDRAVLSAKRKHKVFADDYAYELALLELEQKERGATDPMEETEIALATLAIEYRFGKVSAYDCDVKEVQIEHPDKSSTAHQIAMLDVDLKHEKITENEYEKKIATLKEEPWVGIINQGFEPDKGLSGVFFEFDWNEYWIIFLRMNGYYGNTEEQIVDMWFNDVCRSQGVGVQEYDDGTVIPFNGRIVNRTPDR